MKRFRLLVVLGFLTTLLSSVARAQDLAPTVENRLYPVAPNAGGNPTAGQFGGFSTVSSSAETTETVARPENGTLRLEFSYVGGSFAGSVPEFSIGDIIGTPLATFTDSQQRTVSLRREPVRRADADFLYQTQTGGPVASFQPATAILSERYFWTPNPQFATVPDLSGQYERVTGTGETGTRRDGFVYASQGGSSRLYWRTDAPIGVNTSNQPIYGLVERVVTVSTSSRLPIRRIFWTEEGFQGQAVAVPKGEIQQVRIAYTDIFPDLVPDGSQYVPTSRPPGNNNTTITRNTLWYEYDSLKAYNREGRVLVELLAETRNSSGLRRQVGIEVVDVIQEAVATQVELPIGERLYPLPNEQATQQSYPLPAAVAARNAALTQISTNLALFNPALVLNQQTPGAAFTTQFQVASQTAYYATRSTTSASDVQIFWREPGLAQIQWPKFLNRYHQFWPDDLSDYAVNIRPSDASLVPGTLPLFGDATPFELVYQDDPNDAQARLGTGVSFEVGLDASDPVNRALLLFRSGNDFWFVRVESVLDTQLTDPRYADFYSDRDTTGTALTAYVGDRIAPPAQASTRAGYVDFTKGNAIDPTAYVDPFAKGIAAAEAGAIIPVNAAPNKGTQANQQLGIWWFKKIDPPTRLAGKISSLYWPSFYRKYRLTWPLNAPQIVLASNRGSGDLSADAAIGSIYTQNDPAKAGYNPNEEHAQMISGRAYALRDDLNTVNTGSSPYVLVRYTDAADHRPAIQTFRVLRENETYTFRYDAKAGTILQAPLPLSIMPPPLLPPSDPAKPSARKSRNTEVTVANIDPPVNSTLLPVFYKGFTFEDRKGSKWVYRAQHNPATGGDRSLGMKFYYPTQPGFAYPNTLTGVDEAPSVGTLTPFLWDRTNGDNKTGTSITLSYTPYWPDRGAAGGLRTDYFNNETLQGAPVLTRNEQVLNLETTSSPAPGVNATFFSSRSTGFIVIPTTGAYTFYLTGDDGIRLWINDVVGTPAIDKFFAQAPTEYATATYNFNAGQRVPVRIDYFQLSAGATLQLRWQGPGIVKAILPFTNLASGGGVTEEVPELQFAETLVTPKNGLPGLQGASSAEVLYQQSLALDPAAKTKSAILHDPTRRKITLLTSGGLDALPASIAVSQSGGRTYFQNLPAHLQERFYLDPNLGSKNPARGGLVLEGQFKSEIVGDSYVLPNILSAGDLSAIKALVLDSDTRAAAWKQAIDDLATTVQTFVENPAVPGTYIPDLSKDLPFKNAVAAEITDDDQAVDSYALTGVGGGTGYVTLLLGNGEAFTDEGEPVQMTILRVGPQDLYRGQVKPLAASNPLSENLTMQHTGDFGGRVQDYEFQWFYSPPVDGQPPSNLPGQPGASWFGRVNDSPRLLIDGTEPLLTLTDNYYVMRYRPKVGHVLRPDASIEGWSEWTAPALAEGWIKRVLAGINPFNQRLSDFYNNAINTDVSLLTQAGTRWEGDLPLTLASAQDAGLISIYETVLRRGINLSINGTPSIDYGPANDALLLAAGYLNDLYMALGNEAYADAANPLISLDIDPSRLLINQGLPSSLGTTIQSTASARFAFQGQVPTLLDEELTLLRGRDDTLVPGDRVAPVYNRFYWNFTRGIDVGEVIYALNYNITEKSGPNADGKIDAADASRQYPQGHGDAYGHYLTALKNYYRLLTDPNFTWTPRVEAVNILGVPVTVDYQDERKLAAAAVALGRTSTQIIDLERRKLPVGTDGGWKDLRETRPNSATGITRTWGVEQWAARGGQGNFIHWAVVNSLLPENDVAHEGLQKIDRNHVPELDELTALGSQMQNEMDGANRHTNALNLSDDSILFDLSPTELAAGSSHFDQILARAKVALANAATAHARTIQQNSLLRSVENQASDYNFTVATQETAFANRLYDIYGQPYAGDIGPGKTYPQGYSGPDFLRFMYIDRPYIYSPDKLYGAVPDLSTYVLPIKQSSFLTAISTFNNTNDSAQQIAQTYNSLASSTDPKINITYVFDRNAGPFQIATPAMGQRNSTGSVQTALAAVLSAREQLSQKLGSLNTNRESYKSTLAKFSSDLDAKIRIRGLNTAFTAAKLTINKAVGANALIDDTAARGGKTALELGEAVSKAFPTVNGLSNDVTSGARSAALFAAVSANKVLDAKAIAGKVGTYLLNLGVDLAELAKNEAVTELNAEIDTRNSMADLRNSYNAIFASIQDLDAANKELGSALENYRNTLVTGITIQEERETFRKRAATAIQGSRIRDVAFRAFRTESLEQYKTLYDQSARYAFLAAKAYDYETAQLGTISGRSFLAGIVSTRALGLVGNNGEPQFGGASTGDPGLSSYLAKLQADWNVAKGRLGINNPDQYGTLFSLRRELFNLPYKEDGSVEDDTAWQDKLRSLLVADLRTDPTIAAHALPTSNPSGLAQPGFVINFPTTIETGQNFFAKALQAGDSAFSTASYSTKINSIGISFQGYKGMNPYASGSTGIPAAPTQNSPDALSATPYVYFLPGGEDSLRTPPLSGATSTVRTWLVQDYAVPLPYNIGGGGFGQTTTWNSSTVLSEPFFTPRKHQPFRAVSDPSLFYSTIPAEFTNRRLIGRSVWNSNWKLVIPAQTLLADPQEGIERFIHSVKDIKVFMRSYSNAGN